MIYIYAVHKNAETDVIERVRYTDYFGYMKDYEATKREMIRHINARPYTVQTMYRRGLSWVSGEYVHVVDNEYLRTDANHKREDNLGELIEY